MEKLNKENAILIDIDGTICDSHISHGNTLNGNKRILITYEFSIIVC